FSPLPLSPVPGRGGVIDPISLSPTLSPGRGSPPPRLEILGAEGESLLRLHRPRRPPRQLAGIFANLLEHLLHSPLELRIAAVEDRLRVVLHLDVGIHSVPFDDPLA